MTHIWLTKLNKYGLCLLQDKEQDRFNFNYKIKNKIDSILIMSNIDTM